LAFTVSVVRASSLKYYRFVAVTYDTNSLGQLAMLIYEWEDAQYLGKVTSLDEDLPVSLIICVQRNV
jgi:hypothetical protein